MVRSPFLSSLTDNIGTVSCRRTSHTVPPISTWVTSQASARQASAQQASARPATMATESLQSTKSTNAQHVTCSGDHTD